MKTVVGKIIPVNSLRFLGLRFNNDLSFAPQFDHIKTNSKA